MHKVEVRKKGEEVTEIHYRMLDVVHPQQERQLGSEKKQNATALASISLYKPTMIFEFSSANPDANWKEVETIFWKAIAHGVGGKTSKGCGLVGHTDQRPAIVPISKTNAMLIGQEVSPTLRSGEAEFRPNLFKASLRGHFQRLLAGVADDRSKLKIKLPTRWRNQLNGNLIAATIALEEKTRRLRHDRCHSSKCSLLRSE
ncbi:MAG: hypothetical protein LH702_09035 [Phormidesmis sp. CAN_BIN44]|nr:hypothetical protein [Phormidesmis sp. CAN_BIN44]